MPRSFIIGRIWSVVTTSMSGLIEMPCSEKEMIEVVSVRLAVQQDKRIVGKLSWRLGVPE